MKGSKNRNVSWKQGYEPLKFSCTILLLAGKRGNRPKTPVKSPIDNPGTLNLRQSFCGDGGSEGRGWWGEEEKKGGRTARGFAHNAIMGAGVLLEVLPPNLPRSFFCPPRQPDDDQPWLMPPASCHRLPKSFSGGRSLLKPKTTKFAFFFLTADSFYECLPAQHILRV